MMPVAQNTGTPQGAYSSGNFDCCSDCNSCMYGLFCSPCAYGTLAQSMGKDCTGECCKIFWIPAIANFVCAGTGICVEGYFIQQTMNELEGRLGIAERTDFCCACFCGACVVCKGLREVKNREAQGVVIQQLMPMMPGMMMAPQPVQMGMQPMQPGMQPGMQPMQPMQPGAPPPYGAPPPVAKY